MSGQFDVTLGVESLLQRQFGKIRIFKKVLVLRIGRFSIKTT